MDYKKEAGKQYVKYFFVWFIIIGILAVTAAVVVGMNVILSKRSRSNTDAPDERVYDYAGILSEDQKEALRTQIARTEQRVHLDIVLVTLNQPMEGDGPMRQNDAVSPSLEDVMEAYADNFWDDSGYGYNKSFEGDGLILVDNVYEDQGYWQISTSGEAERQLSSGDINRLLDVIEEKYDSSPFRAYSEFVDAVSVKFDSRNPAPIPYGMILLIPIVSALIYAFVNSRQKKAEDTTTAGTYVPGGRPVMNSVRDDFTRKTVTQRHIQTSSGGGGHSGHSGGGGGHHHSRSGASHGGGGRRH